MSSVLETFLILFESDASKVKKEAGEAEHVTARLTERINLGHGAAIRLGEALHENVLELGAMVGGLLAIRELGRSFFEGIDYAAELHESAEALGVTIKDLGAWGDAVHYAGGSAQEFTGTLDRLNANIAMVDVTGRSRVAPFFNELGIRMKDAGGKAKPTLDLLLEISSAFEKMSKSSSEGFGRKLGLDQGTIQLLQMGRAEVEKLVAREAMLGSVTEKQAEQAVEFRRNWADTQVALRSLGLDIASILLPPLTELLSLLVELVEDLRGLPEWLDRNRQHLEALGIVAGIVGGIFAVSIGGEAVAGVVKLITVLRESEVVIAVFAALMQRAAIATLAATWPIVAIIAFLAILFLTIDDLISYLHGGKSLLGPQWAAMAKFFRDLVEDIKELWQWLSKISFAGIGGAARDLSHLAGFGHAQAALRTAGAMPIGAMSSGALAASTGMRSSSNSVNIGAVNVQTHATDADGMAQAVTPALDRHLRNALTASDDGVKR